MSGPGLLIVRTGTANLASVRAALRRAGVEVRVGVGAGAGGGDIATARAVVLPGVGSFEAAMDKLRAEGLVEALRARVLAGRPTLAICLGLQLLGAGSAESPGARGLGVFSLRAERFEGTARAPHLGWNVVEAESSCRFVRRGAAYFANAYRLREVPPGWRGAFTDHGGRFVAALERGGVLACQFHPELSGAWGAALLERWLAGAA